MAKFIPPELPHEAPRSERVTAEALSALPAAWTVLWDIPFGIFARPKPGLRQVDFVLLHQRHGIIVLEVKGGGISVKDGTWFTTPYGGTEIALSKSPSRINQSAGS
jgi:hypothetical protein